MADRNYPADPRKVPRLPLATYLAVLLEELRFPKLTDTDMAELKDLIEGFVYAKPADAWELVPR